MAARTELQRQVLQYMRGARITLELETAVLTRTLDELVARGDLELWKVGKPDTFERAVEYRLTSQGRGPDEPPELEPAPVSPKLPPLSPGGAIMLESLTYGEPVFLSELHELIEKGYLSPDQLKELIRG